MIVSCQQQATLGPECYLRFCKRLRLEFQEEQKKAAAHSQKLKAEDWPAYVLKVQEYGEELRKKEEKFDINRLYDTTTYEGRYLT